MQWLASRTMDQGVPGWRPGCGTVCCGLKQVTFTHCLVGLLNPGSRGRTTLTNCDEAEDYVVPNVLCPRDLVSRPDNMAKLYYHHEIYDRFVTLLTLKWLKSR